MLIQSPCINCPDRKVGCHTDCEKYIAFRAENERLKAELLASKKKTQVIDGHDHENHRRIIKRIKRMKQK